MKPVLPVLIIAAVALPGCGGKQPASAETQVRATLQSFGTAVAKHQYGRLCNEILAPKLLAPAQSIGLPCEVALRKSSLASAQDPKLTVGTITVKGTSASAEVKTAASNGPPSTDTVELVKIGKRWKISALGAAPAARSPSPTPTEAR